MDHADENLSIISMDSCNTIHDSHSDNINKSNSIQKSLQCMLYILGGHMLAPTPLPKSVLDEWMDYTIDVSLKCEYCGNKHSRVGFPQVDISLENQTITFNGIERVCNKCLNIIDLNRLLAIIDEAFSGNENVFSEVYDHFKAVNNIIDGHDIMLQDLISIAFSLRKIQSLKFCDIPSNGYFMGTNFEIHSQPQNEVLLKELNVELNKCKQYNLVYGRNISLSSPVGLANFISCLPVYCKKRISSTSVKILGKMLLKQVNKIPTYNMLKMLKAMNCVSFHSCDLPRACKFIINEYPYQKDSNPIIIQSIALELCYMCNDEMLMSEYLKIASDLIPNAEISDLLRIGRLYKSTLNYKHIYAKEIGAIVERLLDFDIVLNHQFTLDDCNFIIGILDVLSIFLSNRIKNNSELNTRAIFYLNDKLYLLIISGINRFTADNVVSILDNISTIGRPYNMNLIEAICAIYIKHLAQYSIGNIIKVNSILQRMQIYNQHMLLETLIVLPRIESSITNVEHVIDLVSIYTKAKYASGLFRQFIGQLKLQLAHKYSKEHKRVGLII
ncbi:hypothetical protein BdWA1_003030 [Babesia duncani]|uniref:Uncharacterized protein n=1 Tax=Babesia duncani TaxID=323732 RepID=A0AAD9UMX5_9APIC|nr:hypothetical protein BdWA1_003030 [Babesia duncani]